MLQVLCYKHDERAQLTKVHLYSAGLKASFVTSPRSIGKLKTLLASCLVLLNKFELVTPRRLQNRVMKAIQKPSDQARAVTCNGNPSR